MEVVKQLYDMIKNDKWNEFVKTVEKNEDIDVNIRDNSNNYMINYAIIKNKIDAVKILLKRGAKMDIFDQDGRTILYIPIKYGYDETIKTMIDFNKDSIGISLIDVKDRRNNIPLHYAINFRNLNAIKMLLNNGSDLTIYDNEGYTSLHLAVLTKQNDICEEILKHNPPLDFKTRNGETALHIACNFQLYKIVDMLIKKGANVNIQDNDHHFTPLHYTVNLGNFEIFKRLIEAGASLNYQDFMGNTPIHYVIVEENYRLLKYMLESKTKMVINVNLYNIDNKLPIHLLIEKNNHDSRDLSDLIEASNLNFPDNNGNTPLTLLVMLDKWKHYTNMLSKKKLDIFYTNKQNRRPIDYVLKDDFDKFIDLTVTSYLYILRNTPTIWKEDWENLCTKEMFKSKLTKEELIILQKTKNNNNNDIDICGNIVKNKILQIYKEGSKCNYTSYPSKKNKKCVQLETTDNVEFCTFTGITLDILIGLIYLLNKHKNSCAPVSSQFIENKELCAYYKSVGIDTTTKCEFLNFEIVWVQFKLYFSSDFASNFQKCSINQNIRFIIIPLGIEIREGNHANYLIYDKQLKELERFEPYGSDSPYKFDYNSILLDSLLENKFKELDQNITYIKPSDYMPKIGFQYFDVLESKTKKIGDPRGFCAMWAIWYTDYRITYEDIDRKKLVKQLMDQMKRKNLSYKNTIRNYSNRIISIRDKLFEKVGITINDWLNDQYTSEQIELVIKQINILLTSTSTSTFS